MNPPRAVPDRPLPGKLVRVRVPYPVRAHPFHQLYVIPPVQPPPAHMMITRMMDHARDIPVLAHHSIMNLQRAERNGPINVHRGMQNELFHPNSLPVKRQHARPGGSTARSSPQSHNGQSPKYHSG